MYRKTGEFALGSGVYHSDCRCKSELTVRKGDKYPVCPKCKHLVGWMFTRSVLLPPPGRKNPPGPTPS